MREKRPARERIERLNTAMFEMECMLEGMRLELLEAYDELCIEHDRRTMESSDDQTNEV